MGFEGLASDFAREALELLDELEQVLLTAEESRSPTAQQAAATRRLLHTLKGNAGLVGAADLQAALHRMEDLAETLDTDAVAALLSALGVVRAEAQAIAAGREVGEVSEALRRIAHPSVAGPVDAAVEAPVLSDEIRVPARRFAQLLAAAGDLFVQRTHLLRLARADSGAEARGLAEAAERLAGSLDGLHELLLELHLVPAGQLFGRFRRLLRDECRRCGRQARLQVVGAEVRADKMVLERLADPLMHLVRNAIVHGLEEPEARRQAGKPAEGQVTLSARLQGTTVEIAVEDDGRGLDRAAIDRRARALGLEAGRRPEELIFEAGLSTAALSASAGRGVGLDAVRLAVYRLGGQVAVESRPGAGTRFVLRVPRSVAIERALLCRLADETYAVPVASILEASRTSEARLRWLGRGAALEYAGSLVPVVETDRLLGVAARQGGYALVLNAGQRAALRVDAVLEQEDFVFQPLDPDIRGAAPVTAAALLADGRVVFRLDPDTLVSATTRGA